MKIAMIVVRTLMGLLFIFASLAYFFNLVQQPELQGKTKEFMEGMMATGYMLPMLKVIELLCGIAFVIGRFVPLAAVIIAPIVVNIFMFHAVLDRAGLPVAIFLVIGNVFLAYYFRKHFASLFEAK